MKRSNLTMDTPETNQEDEDLNIESPKKRHKKSDNLLAILQRQVEFYFSDTNLRHDSMMSELTGAQKKSSFLRGTNWVLAEQLMKFNKMKELAKNGVEDIFLALETGKSTLLEVDRDEKRIRRFQPLPLKELEKDTTPCTIYVEGIDMTCNQETLREEFSSHGQVSYISLPHFPEGHPINKGRTQPMRQGYAFVEFSQPAEALKAYHHYNNLYNIVNAPEETTFLPRVMMKSTWLEYLNRYNKIQKYSHKYCKRTIVIKSKFNL